MDKWFYIWSSVWHAISSSQAILYSHCRWIIGKDSHVSFWKDNWLGEPLVSFIDVSNSTWDPSLKVSELLDNNGNWLLLAEISNLFPNLASQIRLINVALYGK